MNIQVGTKFQSIEPALHHQKYEVVKMIGERIILHKTNNILDTLSGKDNVFEIELSLEELIDQIGNTLKFI